MTTKLPLAIAQLIDAAADKHGVPRSLARAVAWVETLRNMPPDVAAKAVSTRQAMGIMQIKAATAKEMGVKNPFDPVQNIDGGVRYLKRLIDKFGESGGLAAYNWGPGNLTKAGKTEIDLWPAQVRGYVDRVLERAKVEFEAVLLCPHCGQPWPQNVTITK